MNEMYSNWSEKSTGRINSTLNMDEVKIIEPEDIENSSNYANWSSIIETNIKRKITDQVNQQTQWYMNWF